MNQIIRIITDTIFFIGIAVGTFALCVSAFGQEIEGPTEPEYVLTPNGRGINYPEQQYLESDTRNERERSRTENQRTQQQVVEDVVRDLSDFCILTPIPIDDRYVGCLIHFPVEEARVDTWN